MLEELPFVMTLAVPSCVTELGMPCSKDPLFILALTEGDWILDPLKDPKQEDVLLPWCFSYVFVSEVSEHLGCFSENCNSLASSHPLKTGILFCKNRTKFLFQPFSWNGSPTSDHVSQQSLQPKGRCPWVPSFCWWLQSFPHLFSEHRHEPKPCINMFLASFCNMEMTAVAACEAEIKWINECQQTVGRGTEIA